MGCFIIKVNGSLRVDSGKHYLGSLSFGGFECVSDNAVPGNYNYDNCGFIASGNYTHIVEGDLILNNEFKAIPYALYVVSGGVSWSEDPTVELTFAMGYIGAFSYFIDNISLLEQRICDDLFINKSVFIDVFSVLELFLSDFLLACIYSSDEQYDNAVNYFKLHRKESTKEVDEILNIERKIHNFFTKTINYHRFEKIAKLYKSILYIDIPRFNVKYLYKRNNIIHRASLSSIDRMRMTIINRELLTQFISDVKFFVNEIVNLYNKSK